MCHVFSTSAPVTSVSFSRDGQCVLASTLDSKLRLIDKDTGELLNTLALLTEVHGVRSCWCGNYAEVPVVVCCVDCSA